MSAKSSKTPLAVATSNGLSNQDMWAMYVQGLIDATGLPNGNNLILLGTTVPANLAITSQAVLPAPTTGQALAQIYSFGDQMVNPTGFYTLSGQSFFSDYATYIDNLQPQGASPTPSQQAAINVDKGNLAKAINQYDSDFKNAVNAYNQQSPLFPGKWPDFQAFLNGTPWGTTLNSDQNAINGANSQLDSLYTQIFGQDYVAIENAKTVVDQVRAGLTGSSPSSTAQMVITTDAGNFVKPTYIPS